MKPLRNCTRVVWILGMRVVVEFTRDVITCDNKKDTEDGHFEYGGKETLIRISGVIPWQHQAAALYHEVEHAAEFLWGTRGKKTWKSKSEERRVKAREMGIWSVLHDPRNRWFRRFVLGKYAG